MSHTAKHPLYQINDYWSFNPNEQTVESPEQSVSLRKKNAEVLLALLTDHGTTVTAETLYESVWGGKCVSEGVIKRSICDLRNVFGDDDKQIIVTVPKQGYRLAAKVSLSQVPETTITEITANQDIPESHNQPAAPVNKQHADSTFKGFPFLLTNAVTMTVTAVICFMLFSSTDNVVAFDDYWEQNTSPIFTYEVMNLANKKLTSEQMLDNLKQKHDALHEANPEREVLARQLIAAYIHEGRFTDVVVLTNKMLRDIEKVHGTNHLKTIKARQFAVDALLLARKIPAAYEMAKVTVEMVKEHHGDNVTLLALSHFQFADANLSCVYPYCDRFEAKAIGRDNIEDAIAYIHQDDNHDPVLMADALMLKNWFSEDVNEKLELVLSALKTYLVHLEKYDFKTAVAYSQLGKIERHWNRDYQQAQRYFDQALDIFTILFDSDYQQTKRLKFDLAWLHLEQQNFAQAIEYAQLDISDNYQCLRVMCLNTLVILVKAHLYRGDVAKASELAAYFQDILADQEKSIPFSLLSEIKTLHLRLQNENAGIEMTINAIKSRIAKEEASQLTAKNDIAIYAIIHELQFHVLQISPQSLNVEKYLLYLDVLTTKYFYSYMTQADRHFIITRAQNHCHKYSEQLCQRMQLQSENNLVDIGPWQQVSFNPKNARP